MSDKTGAEVLAELRALEAERQKDVDAARDRRRAERERRAHDEAIRGMRGPAAQRAAKAGLDVVPRERALQRTCRRCNLQAKGLVLRDGVHESQEICDALTAEAQRRIAKAREKEEADAGASESAPIDRSP